MHQSVLPKSVQRTKKGGVAPPPASASPARSSVSLSKRNVLILPRTPGTAGFCGAGGLSEHDSTHACMCVCVSEGQGERGGGGNGTQLQSFLHCGAGMTHTACAPFRPSSPLLYYHRTKQGLSTIHHPYTATLLLLLLRASSPALPTTSPLLSPSLLCLHPIIAPCPRP